MGNASVAIADTNVLYVKKGAIAYVTINRPKVLNALNGATLDDLRIAFEDARDDVAIRGVIVTGAGERAFIAGADINELARLSAVEAKAASNKGHALFDLVENLGKPVIAAVNGFALGGGCETAMACTIRLATEHAKFGQPEVKLGLIPGYGGTQRLARLVGKGRALQLILTGGMMNAQEAYRIGLVNEIVPPAGLIARAEAILQEIIANAPLAVRFAIEAVNQRTGNQPGGRPPPGGLAVRDLRRHRRQEGRHVGLPRQARGEIPRCVRGNLGGASRSAAIPAI